MSDPPVLAQLDELHAALAGYRVGGGCADCDAYLTLTKCGDGIFLLTTHHDDDCPFYRGVIR
jgi:hypothetical protein